MPTSGTWSPCCLCQPYSLPAGTYLNLDLLLVWVFDMLGLLSGPVIPAMQQVLKITFPEF